MMMKVISFTVEEKNYMSKKHLVKSTTIVASCTMFSRLFGFARDMIVAQLFGASIGVDAFLVANKIPNFMRRLFAEGAFSQAFVPVLSEFRKTKSESEIKQFINHVTGVLSLSLFLITILGVLFAPIVIMVFAPGFVHDGPRFELSESMLRITFPYLLFISLTALSGAILNSYDRFAVPAFTPVLLNFSLIACALWLAPHMAQPITALAVGVFIAGIVQLIFQFPFLLKLRRLPIPIPSLKDPGVRQVMRLMVPALFGVSIAQINILIDQWFASFLQVGSISWLYYSDRITQLPLGVFGIAIATVILPSLSRQHAGQDKEQYCKTLDWGLKTVLLIGLPAALGVLLLAGPIITTLFNYGEFDAFDVVMTQRSLIAFGIGVPAFMLVKVLASGFYAKQNIKLPVQVGVIALVTNTALSLCLIWTLKHAGLALSTSIAAIVNALLLYILLVKKGIFTPEPGWLKFLLQLFVALALMAVVLVWLAKPTDVWIASAWPWRVSHLSVAMVLAGAAYFIGLRISGYRWKKI
jgi:putative peptidoglycan lipid II flippase